MRLQKFLALREVNSRRKAEDLIAAGVVTVNGHVAKLGTCIDPAVDTVAIDGITVSAKAATPRRAPLVLLLNKPAGYVCSHGDRFGRRTVFDLVPREFRGGKLMFCGRLDMETEGLLILTDNGDVAQEITHPSAGIGKHYEAVISRPLPGSLVPKLLAGIEDGGEFLKFDKIIPIGRGHMRGLSFEIVLSQGKKNEIHRVFGHFGIFVKRLRRTRIGGLTMRGVGPGKCRLLGEKEIALLLHKSF